MLAMSSAQSSKYKGRVVDLSAERQSRHQRSKQRGGRSSGDDRSSGIPHYSQSSPRSSSEGSVHTRETKGEYVSKQHAENSQSEQSEAVSPTRVLAGKQGASPLKGESSASSTEASLARKTEEDMSLVSPLYL